MEAHLPRPESCLQKSLRQRPRWHASSRLRPRSCAKSIRSGGTPRWWPPWCRPSRSTRRRCARRSGTASAGAGRIEVDGPALQDGRQRRAGATLADQASASSAAARAGNAAPARPLSSTVPARASPARRSSSPGPPARAAPCATSARPSRRHGCRSRSAAGPSRGRTSSTRRPVIATGSGAPALQLARDGLRIGPSGVATIGINVPSKSNASSGKRQHGGECVPGGGLQKMRHSRVRCRLWKRKVLSLGRRVRRTSGTAASARVSGGGRPAPAARSAVAAHDDDEAGVAGMMPLGRWTTRTGIGRIIAASTRTAARSSPSAAPAARVRSRPASPGGRRRPAPT